MKKHILIGITASIVLFFFFGIPTAMISNPFFTRMTPIFRYDWLIFVLTSLLAGIYIGLYYYKKEQQSTRAVCAATSGGFLSIFSFGCAICNKMLVFLLGFTGIVTYFMPIQPYVGVLSVGLLSYGIYTLGKQ